MDLDRFSHFIALAEELHFGRAATRVGISQPQISQSLKRLEAAVGVELVQRAHRNVMLTPAGEAFLQEARKALSYADHATRAARRIAAGGGKVVRVGFVSSVIRQGLPAAIRNFRCRWKNVELRLEDLPSVNQIANLESGELDIAIVDANACELAGLATRKLHRSAVCAAVPAHWPEASRPEIDLADLASRDFVMFTYQRAPKLYRALIAACEDAGFMPRILQEASHTDTVMALIAGGLGMSLMPHAMSFIAPANVKFVPLRNPPADCGSELFAVWRTPITSTQLSFVEILGEAVREATQSSSSGTRIDEHDNACVIEGNFMDIGQDTGRIQYLLA